jgi:hypothetical protein
LQLYISIAKSIWPARSVITHAIHCFEHNWGQIPFI